MSYANPRIKLHDTFQSAIIKMSDGNPGALRVLLELFEHGNKIEPDAFSGRLAFLNLDTLDRWRSTTSISPR
jgi:hypothetical protein